MTDLLAPFELIERDGMPQFRHAPADLRSLIDRARQFGARDFIVEGERRVSYAEAFALGDALAARLGIAPGERVAIVMRNRVEWVTAFLAVVRAGGVAVLVNSRGSPTELCGAVIDCEPALVLADAERAARLADGGYAGPVLTVDGFPAADQGDDGFIPPPPAAPEDPAAIMFTSGTTGRVKGAVMPHRAIVNALLGMQRQGLLILSGMAEKLGVDPAALIAQAPPVSVLLVYPLFHISGLATGFLATMLAGGKIVIMRRWNVPDALALIEREKLTNVGAVPTMLWDLVHHPATATADLTSVRNIGIGGQAVARNLLDASRKAFPTATHGTGYGQTETAGVFSMIMGDEFVRHPSTSGQVVDIIRARVIDDDGNEVPAGHVGELVARGPTVMLGYYGRPDDTRAAFTADGWLRTGDVGMIDAHGLVTIIDRKKDMVISGGENIYCAEVERALGQIPGVTEYTAFGIPDERLGELLVAAVVGEGITEQGVIDHVAETLARYKAPGRVAVVEGPLPRNHMDKVDKAAMRHLWPQLIGDA